MVEAARLLLERGADVNACDASSGMPLHYAIRKGRVEMVAFLLGRGAEANARKRFRWPMETAAMRGNLEIVRLLLEHGAEGSWESLRVSARNGNREIAACLLDHGCFAGEREIMEAAVERHIEILELLVAHYRAALLRAAEKEGETEIVAEL